ncbi:MAG: 30S ribosomal protein S2 [Parcubacteria group bacterium]|nr:30S ribosomal protein S2 [Parcubacteria group bacterium]
MSDKKEKPDVLEDKELKPELEDLEKEEKKPVKVPKGFDLEEMMQAGIHLGHRTSKLHPRMNDFVVGIRNTVHVIDLEKTAQYLQTALEFLAQAKKDNKRILFVSTKTPLKRLVKEIAEELNIPYVTERWLGGTFTNFEIIRKRADYFRDLKAKQEKGELSKYTKKERYKMKEELQKLEVKFGGIEHMDRLPDIVFLCDIVKDDLPLKEAKMQGIKTVGIIDTNADPLAVDYPIPANDDAISSVRYILEKVKATIEATATVEVKQVKEAKEVKEVKEVKQK